MSGQTVFPGQDGRRPCFRGVLFDLDGTLLDTAEGVLASVQYTIETMGYPSLPDEILRAFIGPPVKQSLIRAYGISEEEAQKATQVFRGRYKEHDLFRAVPYPGIPELLKRLRSGGFLIGVATLKREDYAISLLEHFGIAALCDSICGSDFDSKMSKCDVILKCLQKLQLAAHDAVLIGDTASDGEGARLAGVPFIAVTYGFGPVDREGWNPFQPLFTADSADAIGRFLLREPADPARF